MVSEMAGVVLVGVALVGVVAVWRGGGGGDFDDRHGAHPVSLIGTVSPASFKP